MYPVGANTVEPRFQKPLAASVNSLPENAGWILTATMLASSLAFIDGSVTNEALPLSALLLTGGAAGDHFGRRRMLIVGTAVFAIASTLCAVASNLTPLLGARALQGF